MLRVPLKTSALVLSVLSFAATLAIPPAAADFPWDEAGDVVWCADVASRTARDIVNTYVAYYGKTVTANYYGVKCKLRTHAPIVINGDPTTTDKAQLLLNYGIIDGTGTASDPYIIQGWSISRSQSLKVYSPTSPSPTIVPLPVPATAVTPVTDWGIQLLNVNKHYIIDGIHVEGYRCDGACNAFEWGGPRGAIKIIAASGGGLHVTVRGSALIDNDKGVYVSDRAIGNCPPCGSRGSVTVIDNIISAQGYAIMLGTAMHDSTVSDNRIERISVPVGSYTEGYMAIVMDSSRNARLDNNQIDGVFQGIYLWFAHGVFGGGNKICAKIPYTDDFASGPNGVGWSRVAGCTMYL